MFDICDLTAVPLPEALQVLTNARQLKLAAEVQEAIAILHIVQNYHLGLPDNPMPGAGRLIEIAADGGPAIHEFVPLELSAALGMSQQSVTLLIHDLLNLEHRHPLLWQQVRAGQVPLWQARRIVQQASHAQLGHRQALELDRLLSPHLPGLTPGRGFNLAAGLIAAIDPLGAERRAEQRRRSRFVKVEHLPEEGIGLLYGQLDRADARRLDLTLNRLAAALQADGDDDDREQRRATAIGVLAEPAAALALLGEPAPPHAPAQPSTHPTPAHLSTNPHRSHAHRSHRGKATIFLHLSDQAVVNGSGVARGEGIGPVLVTQLRRLLRDSKVRIQPVFNPGGVVPVDSYEIPAAIRRAVLLRNPIEVFPFGSRPSRRLDLDHTSPYRFGQPKPPGQTRVDNLGPLSRRAHRAKTHGEWQVQQDQPGQFRWQSPLNQRYLVTEDGRTYRLGGGATDPPAGFLPEDEPPPF